MRLSFVVARTLYFAFLTAACAFSSQSFGYEKAVEGNEVVLQKLYPKKNRIELDGKFGFIMNQSYMNSLLAGGSVSYFFNEEWGLNLEANIAVNSDKGERECVETFYNDPNFRVGSECAAQGGSLSEDTAGDANFGPAYVPIRELKQIFTGNMVWNPIYGKQIVLLSATTYFDFFITMGGGIAMSNFYPKQTHFADGRPSRGVFTCTEVSRKTQQCDRSTNPGTTDEGMTGLDGRPAFVPQNNVLIHLSIGQRFHFGKRFLISGELKNYTLLGTDSGFDMFLSLMGGVGVRF